MARKIYRNHNLIRKQNEVQLRNSAELVLRAAKARTGKLRDRIIAACDTNGGATAVGTLAEEIRRAAWSQQAKEKLDDDQRQTFKVLLLTTEEKSDLLQEIGKKYVFALACLARWSAQWIRKPVDWKPNSHNPARQFASIARHLLCEYDVPSFMDDAWFGRDTGFINSELCQGWFIHIGRGQNIRKAAQLPFPLTKMMAHHFLQAPTTLIPAQAMRWGQIRGAAGDVRLTRALVASRLRTTVPDEPFWLTVINFFIRHSEMLDMSQVGPMIDYIHNQRFMPLGLVPINGTFVRMGPPQPNFSMQKRTIESLMNQTAAWHRQLATAHDCKDLAWNSCGISGFDRIEGVPGNQKRYVIEELLTSKDLAVEGRTMHHCVYSYARSCTDGRTAIYSMKHDLGHGIERRLTIELDPRNKLITQARGKYNHASNELDKRIMQAWATRVGLSYGKYALQRWA